MRGSVHSVESFGTVDGPGVRLVIFMQGCPMRCAYCHNPDTWDMQGGKVTEVSAIIDTFEKNRSYYARGGITVTGGEPLMQIDFLLELFTECKKREIHTCIDTSGIAYHPGNTEYNKKLERLMPLTNLVMLDIKHIDDRKHKALTTHSNRDILAFAQYLSEKNVPLWIRHVVVSGVTDADEDLFRLGYFIGGLKSLKALDVLPYHTMGVEKYQKLGIPYRLNGTPPMEQELLITKKKVILEGIRKRRAEDCM